MRTSKLQSGRLLAFGAGLAFAMGASPVQAASYVVQPVVFPGDTAFTQLLGINNAGTIAGFHGAVTAQGFTLTLPNTFTGQNFPGSAMSMVTAINGAGSTAGIFQDTAGTTHGYTYIGGTFKTVDQSGTVFNQALGINSANTTVGYFALDKAAGQVGQSAYSQSGGLFTSINALLPANQNSQAVGINNAGNVVGFYVDANNVQHGYTEIGGTFASFDPAGSMNTTINGVNDSGQIVGFYTDANDNVIGFVGTPAAPVPEPATISLFVAGLLGLGASRCGRRAGPAPRA